MDYFWNFFNKTSAKPIHGYLALSIEANTLLTNITNRLRDEFKLLPMEMADPPRERGAFHVTIAMFKSGITEQDLETLRQEFQGKKVTLTITGYGVAVKQDSKALYLSVEAPEIEKFRHTIQEIGLPYLATDPHITFGVHEGTRKDVHGVPKPRQIELEPFVVSSVVQFKSGPYTLL